MQYLLAYVHVYIYIVSLFLFLCSVFELHFKAFCFISFLLEAHLSRVGM